jgi:hypothetical protein
MASHKSVVPAEAGTSVGSCRTFAAQMIEIPAPCAILCAGMTV